MTTKYQSVTRLGDGLGLRGEKFETLHEAMADLDPTDVHAGSVYIVEVITTKVWDSAKGKKSSPTPRGAIAAILS